MSRVWQLIGCPIKRYICCQIWSGGCDIKITHKLNKNITMEWLIICSGVSRGWRDQKYRQGDKDKKIMKNHVTNTRCEKRTVA